MNIETTDEMRIGLASSSRTGFSLPQGNTQNG
ncbi:hypothetical protein ABIC07_005985 [Bradyrhizobium sp. RT9a]